MYELMLNLEGEISALEWVLSHVRGTEFEIVFEDQLSALREQFKVAHYEAVVESRVTTEISERIH